MLISALITAASAGEINVGVEIHNVAGSGVTEQQIRDWIGHANDIWNGSFNFVVESVHNHTEYNSSKNDDNQVNIWGVARKSWGTENISGMSGNECQLTPGDGTNLYIKNSTLAHELGHYFNLSHSDNDTNIMYPDGAWVGGVPKSCHRKDTNTTEDQRNAARTSPNARNQDFINAGFGDDIYDATYDVDYEEIDIDWIESWVEITESTQMLYLTVSVVEFSFETDLSINFYLETDNDFTSGDIDGFDYMISFHPIFEQLYFSRCDDGTWVDLDPALIEYGFNFKWEDIEGTPDITGMFFSTSLTNLDRRQGNLLSSKCVTEIWDLASDTCPNEGLMTFKSDIVCGDADGSGDIDIDDVVYLISYIFSGGPAPFPMVCTGDADGSGGVDIDDVVYLISYIFSGGPEPDQNCCFTEEEIICGDVNDDGEINLVDVVYLEAYVAGTGDPPVPYVCVGDVDSDGDVDNDDVLYLYDYVVGSGPPPVPGCCDIVIICGDVDNTGVINLADAVYLANYLYQGGPPPMPYLCVGDVDGDGDVDGTDLTILTESGPIVDDCCEPPW